MRKYLIVVGVLFLATAVTTLAQGKHVPTPSTWTLNLKLSNFGGDPAPVSDVQELTADTSTHLAFSETMVDDKGVKSVIGYDGPVDGTMHPLTGMPGAMMSWDDKTDTGKSTMPDGSVVTTHLATVTDKQVTFHITMIAKNGKKTTQTLIYDRTK